MSAVTRHLLAAERALTKARGSMTLAERRPNGPDLTDAWIKLRQVSLAVQAERFAAESRDEGAAN